MTKTNLPNTTVAICTFNRAKFLGRVLGAVTKQTCSNPYEILIVDNGSTDDTPRVVGKWATRSAVPIRLINEANLGVAHARNRAINEALGEYVAFVDDDAWPESDWLQELLQVITPENKHMAACVVGKVILDWSGYRPQWIPKSAEPLYCAYDQGNEMRHLTENEYLLTTNALFHRSITLSIGAFRPYLGRKGSKMLGGEDNDIHQRLLYHGYQVMYQPAALVHHHVASERKSRWFLIRRMFGSGATQPLLAYSDAELRREKYPVWQQFAWDCRRSVKLTINVIMSLWQNNSVFEQFLTLIQRLGRLRTHVLLIVRPPL